MTVLSIQPRPRPASCHGRPHVQAESVALTRFLHGARGVGCWFDRVVGEIAGLTDPAPIVHTFTPDLVGTVRRRLDGAIALVGGHVPGPVENGVAHMDLATPVGQTGDRRVLTTRGNSHA